MPGLEGLMRTGRRLVTLLATAGLVCVALPSAAQAHPPGHDRGLRQIDHIVVIYEENHSFDNLYGGWEGVDGAGRRPPTPRTRRRSTRPAAPYSCLRQNDVNLTSPPLARLHRDADGTPSRATSPTRRSGSTTYIRAGGHDVPGARACSRPTAS